MSASPVYAWADEAALPVFSYPFIAFCFASDFSPAIINGLSFYPFQYLVETYEDTHYPMPLILS